MATSLLVRCRLSKFLNAANWPMTAAPDDELQPLLIKYVARGFSNKEIVTKLAKLYDREVYALR